MKDFLPLPKWIKWSQAQGKYILLGKKNAD